MTLVTWRPYHSMNILLLQDRCSTCVSMPCVLVSEKIPLYKIMRHIHECIVESNYTNEELLKLRRKEVYLNVKKILKERDYVVMTSRIV